MKTFNILAIVFILFSSFCLNAQNVGIGKAIPAEKLDVDGNIKMSGDYIRTDKIQRITPIYLRGTGQNNPANRLIQIGSQEVVNSSSRGLTLCIINKADHSVLSTTNYDVYANAGATDDLTIALNALDRNKIGILLSYDAWENAVDTDLDNAFKRLGLFKAMITPNSGSRRPYAAIFEASSSPAVGTARAVEVLHSSIGSAPHAELRGWLIDGSFIASSNVPTALVNNLGTEAVVLVDESNNVGVGTSAPAYKLDVAGTGRYTGQLSIPLAPSSDVHAASKKYVDDLVGAVSETDPVWNSQKSGYYTKTNMQTSGQSAVHWNNLTNVPAGLADGDNQSLSILGSNLTISGGNTVDISSAFSDDWTQSGTNLYPNNNSWDVGIGNTSPAYKLHVGAGNGDGILIGNFNDKLGWDGSSPAAELAIRFAGYRDVASNFTGAKIAAVRTNLCCGGNGGLSTGTELAFYTQEGTATVSGDGNLVERLRIGNGGNVGIGISSPTYKLHVNGRIRSNGINETSDERLKKDITPLKNALEKVEALQGVSYFWRVDEFPEMDLTSRKEIGVIAQEVEKILPELVNTDEEGFKSVQYSHLVPILIEAIKEQQKIIKEKDARLGIVEAKTMQQETRISKLEALISEGEIIRTVKK